MGNLRILLRFALFSAFALPTLHAADEQRFSEWSGASNLGPTINSGSFEG